MSALIGALVAGGATLLGTHMANQQTASSAAQASKDNIKAAREQMAF